MATLTAQNFLEQYLQDNGLQGVLTPAENAIALGRLQARFDAASPAEPTAQQIAIALAGVTAIRNETGQEDQTDLLTDLIIKTEAAKDAVAENEEDDENGDGEGGEELVALEFEVIYEESIHEGEENKITIRANREITEEDGPIEVTVQVIPDGGDADQSTNGKTNANDFGQGALNLKTLTINPGEQEVSHAVTAIDDSLTEGPETYTVEVRVPGYNVDGQENGVDLSVIVEDGTVQGGQTFVLTKEVDYMPGLKGSLGTTDTSGNDTIRGVITSAPADTTFNALDEIDGGAGRDTLKLASEVAAIPTLNNVKNVEVIEISGTAGVTVDSRGAEGAEELNIVKAGGAVAATAADTTDINVGLKAPAAAVGVNGGKDINVNLTDVASTSAVTIGGLTAAAGDVVVEMTGAKADGTVAAASLSAVTVTGGKTITVNQTATSDDAAAATKAVSPNLTTQGSVTITGNADTTEVTVKQTASQAAIAAVEAVEAKAATQEVTFTEAKKGDTVTLTFATNTLKFTAKQDLTAAEVASAFANLATGAVQGNASAELGLYTNASGGVNAGWSSGDVEVVDATKAKVVFSTNDLGAGGAPSTAITAAAGASNTVTVTAAGAEAGVAEVKAVTGQLGIANGAVSITDTAATIKTATVDGFGATTTTTTTALETLNLSNSGHTFDAAGKATGTSTVTVASSAATLALNLEKVGTANEAAAGNGVSAITLTAAPTTLNVQSIGNNYVNLGAIATEALNVSGSGMLNAAASTLTGTKSIKVTESAGLNLLGATLTALTSVDTTGTTGTTVVAIEGGKATYAGGAGVDHVIVADATVAISKDINLGAGNDRLDLSAGVAAIPTVDVDGGAGEDTLVLSATAAMTDALSANTAFAAKIKNFERLELTAAVVADDGKTVDLEKLGFTDYVITNGVQATKGITLDKLANNATVELKNVHATGATDGTLTLKLADATGSSDTLNLITNLSTADENFGTIVAAGVETLTLKANDNGDGATKEAGLTLTADKATNLTIDGNSHVDLTLAGSDKLATIDGSAMTGALTVTTNGAVATTVKGGAGDDVLTAAGANDVLIGGAGSDTLIVTTGSAVTLTGGAGIDHFDVSGYIGTVGGAATITDFEKGETIKFQTGGDFNSGKVTLIAEATFTEYVTEAMKVASVNGTVAKGVAWFQFNNNTFIVQNVAADNTFDEGTDIIVKLTGMHDLSDSSFNDGIADTLLYI